MSEAHSPPNVPLLSNSPTNAWNSQMSIRTWFGGVVPVVQVDGCWSCQGGGGWSRKIEALETSINP